MAEVYADGTYEHCSDTDFTPGRETPEIRYVTSLPAGRDIPVYAYGEGQPVLVGLYQCDREGLFVGDTCVAGGSARLILDTVRGIAVPDYSGRGPMSLDALVAQRFIFGYYGEFLDRLTLLRLVGLPSNFNSFDPPSSKGNGQVNPIPRKSTTA